MINWVKLAFNAVWITGIAILVAQHSYISWEASIQSNQKPLNKTGTWITIVATMMTGIGLLIVSDTIIQRLIWGLLTCALIFITYKQIDSNQRSLE